MQYILDLDDFHEGNTQWHLLAGLRALFPKFKVTLFTIPGRCTLSFVRTVQEIPWIQLVPHGWMHRTSTECAYWEAGDMHTCLDNAEAVGLTTKGFKAPGWQISDACYRVLQERGYWVADQAYNNHRRPRGLGTYILNEDGRIHGHLGSSMDNDLTKIYPRLLTLPHDAEFGFVGDAVRPWIPQR